MKTSTLAIAIIATAALNSAACADPASSTRLTPAQVADALHAALSANRAVYTREVVARLQDEEGVLKATEHYRDDKALPLPAQMFRMGAEEARKQAPGFTFALLSPWPINKHNAPVTEAEKAGLRAVTEGADKHYGQEDLGGERWFTAVYADRAVSRACTDCHNAHPDSPRRDFKPGDVMGGVVIRVALP